MNIRCIQELNKPFLSRFFSSEEGKAKQFQDNVINHTTFSPLKNISGIGLGNGFTRDYSQKCAGEVTTSTKYWEEELMVCPGLKLRRPRGMEDFIIPSNSFNGIPIPNSSKMCMDLSEFKRLKRIEIGNESFQHVREFVIDGLPSLESVKIGDECFRICWEERDDGLCRITNCPNLRQLEIGDESFMDFKSFELSNVNSLKSIKFGDLCFWYADCSLKDLPSLQTVYIGSESFEYCHVAVFENLPKLHTISFDDSNAYHGDGGWILAGDCEDNRETMINGYESYANTLIMKNLPSLTQIQGYGYRINRRMEYVILENIPNLTENNIRYGEESFLCTADLQATNAPALEKVIREMSYYLRN